MSHAVPSREAGNFVNEDLIDRAGLRQLLRPHQPVSILLIGIARNLLSANLNHLVALCLCIGEKLRYLPIRLLSQSRNPNENGHLNFVGYHPWF